MGLRDKNGNILIENEYRSVKLISTYDSIYLCQTQQDKYGLYYFKTKTWLPCKYDEIIETNWFYKLRIGKKWGWLTMVCADMPNALLVEPMYDAVEFPPGYVIVRSDSLYGFSKLNNPDNTNILAEIPFPIQYDSDHDFYYRLAKDTLVILLPNGKDKHLTQIKVGNNGWSADSRFVHYYSLSPRSLIMVDKYSGRMLPSYSINVEEGRDFYYDSHWLCVIEKKRINFRKKEISLHNPYSGEIFFTCITKGNEELRMDGYAIERNLGTPVKILFYSHSGSQSTERFVGEIVNYKYTPYEKPYIKIGGYQTGDGSKPFFMPGK